VHEAAPGTWLLSTINEDSTLVSGTRDDHELAARPEKLAGTCARCVHKSFPHIDAHGLFQLISFTSSGFREIPEVLLKELRTIQV
jgi:hypothetical protein